MDYVVLFWSPDFSISLLTAFAGLIGSGAMLAGMFWLVGFVVHHLLKTMKGGA